MLARALALGLLVLVPLVAALPAAPLPPGYVDYRIDWIDDGVMGVTVNWTASHPIDTDELATSTTPVAHRVYLASTSVEDTRVVAPFAEVEAPGNSLSFTLPERSTSVVWVTAINVDGAESVPGNPVIIDRDYPPCRVLGFSPGPPPSYILVPGCLVP